MNNDEQHVVFLPDFIQVERYKSLNTVDKKNVK